GVVLFGVVPRRARPLMAAAPALPLLILAANFAQTGVPSGVITYTALAIGIVVSALTFKRRRFVRGRLFVHVVGAIVLLLGVSMAIAPELYTNPRTYAGFGAYIWVFAPLFAVGGAGLIVSE